MSILISFHWSRSHPPSQLVNSRKVSTPPDMDIKRAPDVKSLPTVLNPLTTALGARVIPPAVDTVMAFISVFTLVSTSMIAGQQQESHHQSSGYGRQEPDAYGSSGREQQESHHKKKKNEDSGSEDEHKKKQKHDRRDSEGSDKGRHSRKDEDEHRGSSGRDNYSSGSRGQQEERGGYKPSYGGDARGGESHASRSHGGDDTYGAERLNINDDNERSGHHGSSGQRRNQYDDDNY